MSQPARQRRTTSAIGILAVVAAATCYATATIMARLAYREGADPLAVVAMRFAVGSLALWATAFAVSAPRRLPHGRRRLLVVLGVLSVAVGVLFFSAVERLGAGTATLLLFVHPPLVALLALALRREGFGWVKGVALAISLLGVGLVVGAPGGSLEAAGVLMALGAALALAVYVVTAQRGGEAAHPLVVGAWIMSVAAVVYLVPMAVAGGLDLRQTPAAWGWLLGVGAASGGAFSLFLAAVVRLGPSRSSIGATSEPMLTVALAFLFLGERLTPIQLAGGLLVVVAIALLPLVQRQAVALGEMAAPGRDQR